MLMGTCSAFPSLFKPFSLHRFSTGASRRYVFSGIQPTSSWVSLQSQFPSVLYSIVDLHSITQSQDPALLRVNILVMVASLLACGIDPETSILFQQSQVSEHSELSWILGCLASIPPTQTPASVKGTKHKQKNEGSAVDILLYNNSTRKVKSLRDPSKMSKSDPQKMATVNLLDSPDDIVLKIRSGCTVEAAGLDTGKYKQLVEEAMVVRLTPIREEIERLRGDRRHLERLLAQGAHRARELAAPILKEVSHRVDFY
uniref:Tryptophanyl tRNA synthetase 2, mitochondrial n=1 Tax=Oncorhynchus kisutch TaxID=8019 RepID=A0A8C7GN17_ONCKI